MRRAATGALAAALLASPLRAHDFWIEPSSFRPQVGETVSARLWVGPTLQSAEPFPRFSKLIVTFALFAGSSETPLTGRDGEDPAGTVRIERTGLQWIGYRSRDYPVSIEAAKFEEYLRQEGLEAIAEVRTRRGETGKPAREVFSRAAKALIEAGAPGPKASGYDRNLGFTLELLPDKNPYAAKPGDTLTFRLLYQGKPLPGALVRAISRTRPQLDVAARADKNGRVALNLDAPGFWLVKAVHMVPAPAGVDADWQSLWASLTFEIGPGNPVGKAP
jgi:uncharacterized GH25 family protein